MHTNGIRIWLFKGYSLDLVGYGETSATTLGMRKIDLSSSTMEV